MFFSVFLDLCADRGIKPGKAADEMGIQRDTVTIWKQNGTTPKGANLKKLEDYFGVPNELLLEHPPFDHWVEINVNRKGFLNSLEVDRDLLHLVYDIDIDDPDSARVIDMVDFLKDCITSVYFDGSDWHVTLKETFAQKETPLHKKRNESDIAHDLEAIMEKLDQGGDMLFHGEPLSESALDNIRSAMKLGLKAANLNGKEYAKKSKARSGLSRS